MRAPLSWLFVVATAIVATTAVGLWIYTEFLAPDARSASEGSTVARRLVCQTLFCAEVAAELAPEPDGPIVAWPEIARDATYSLVAAEALTRAVAGSTAEAIVALRPDVVVVATYSRPDTLSQLEALGVRLLRQPDPRGFDEISQSILEIGREIGRDGAAQALVARMNERLRTLALAVVSAPSPRVIGLFGDSVAGAGTTFDAALRAAGLTNAAGAIEGWGAIDQERLLALRPDVVVVPAPDEVEAGHVIAGRPAIGAWQQAGGRVVAVAPALAGTASQRLVDLAIELARRVSNVATR